MGLDIRYYRNLRALPSGEGRDANGEIDDYGKYVGFFVDTKHFADRAEGILQGTVYEFQPLDSGGFRAGSYSGYSSWRETLARIAGYPIAPLPPIGDADRPYAAEHPHSTAAWKTPEVTRALPFYELIDFSDCEGTIGPVTSAKLARDFAAYQEIADGEGEYFRDVYANFRRAFEAAAQNGAVVFT